MTRVWARRERGQAIGLAGVALVAMVGMLAFTIDAGLFFMIRRELQNTADAAALAGMGAWVDCQFFSVPGSPSFGVPAVAPPCDAVGANAVDEYIARNSSVTRRLCTSAPSRDNAPTFNTFVDFPPTGGQSPSTTVSVSCQTTYSFGRILGLSDARIRAIARAAAVTLIDDGVNPVQTVDYTGQFYVLPPWAGGNPPPPYVIHVARLIP
jgi:hypothetical protein